MRTQVTPDTAVVQRRVLTVLAVGQVAAGIGFSTAIALSALTAARISGSEAVGGAAQTITVVGAAIAAFLIARIATRAGRRPALTVAYGTSAVGGAGAVAAVTIGNAPAFLTALLLVGAAISGGLAARFAATDLAPPDRRAKSLSLVVWATTVGAVTGPNLAGPVQNLAGRLGMEPSAGPFLLCTVAFLIATSTAWLGLRPDPLLLARTEAGEPDGGTRVSAVRVRAALTASPPALLGLAGVALGHLVMIAVMSMTPVHMDHHGASLQFIGFVISVHVLGMYAFSPVFGWLADRLGRAPVMLLGAGMLAASGVLAAVAGDTGHMLLTVALLLLGLGWSAGLIAGSALLTDSLPVPVRPSAQGLSDVTMNIAGALGGIIGGLMVATTSYAVLGFTAAAVVVPYAVVIGAMLRHSAVRRRSTVPAHQQ